MSFGVALTTGRTVADVEAWPDRIAKVTIDEVNAAARHVLKDTGSVTAILLGTEKKTALRKAALTPGGEPAEVPEGLPEPVGPGDPPGANEPNGR
jgi:zinc protease